MRTTGALADSVPTELNCAVVLEFYTKERGSWEVCRKGKHGNERGEEHTSKQRWPTQIDQQHRANASKLD